MRLRGIIELATELRDISPEKREEFFRARRATLRETGWGANEISAFFADALALVKFVDKEGI